MSYHNNTGPGSSNGSAKHSKREESGNMLVLVTAVTVGIVAVIAYFSLAYVRLLGSNNEQKTAIEAAALAAARDISRVVVDTPEYGLISISDSAPNGADTTAGDKYRLPARSINTLIATVRLDLIIADKLNDNNLKFIIKEELDSILDAQDQLNDELVKSIKKGATSTDVHGTVFCVYDSAERAYEQNQIRMTGKSSYKKGSLRLSLGALQGGSATNTPVPKPTAMAPVASTQQQNNFYKSYVNIPYDGKDFVLAGISDNVKLVDSKNWTTSVAGLPYQLATIIKAEANQAITSNQAATALNVTSVACAQPANIADPKPAPGALTFSFPDGICPGMDGPANMLSNAALSTPSPVSNCTFQTSENGDFPMGRPATTIDDMDWPYDPDVPISTANVFRRALYDWWFRAGTKVNIASAVTMFTDPTYNFVPPSPSTVKWKSPAVLNDSTIYDLGTIPNGSIHIYKIDPATGLTSYQTKELQPIKYSVIGENQLYSETIGALTVSPAAANTVNLPTVTLPNGTIILEKAKLLPTWDVYIRDQVFQVGNDEGGNHAGEPMDFDKVALLPNNVGGTGEGAWPWKKKNKGYAYGKNRKRKKKAKSSFTPAPKVVEGTGLPPAITHQSDFAESMGYPSTYYYTYSQGPGSQNALRPTYLTNGMAVDIRFRRQIDPGSMAISGTSPIGYVGEKYGTTIPATPTY
jgi:hypothetical protein